jgi:hypothetical protein
MDENSYPSCYPEDVRTRKKEGQEEGLYALVNGKLRTNETSREQLNGKWPTNLKKGQESLNP